MLLVLLQYVAPVLIIRYLNVLCIGKYPKLVYPHLEVSIFYVLSIVCTGGRVIDSVVLF